MCILLEIYSFFGYRSALDRNRVNITENNMSTHPTKDLETFVNPNQERDYTIIIDIPEFTCLCPKTGQPEFCHHQIRIPA